MRVHDPLGSLLLDSHEGGNATPISQGARHINVSERPRGQTSTGAGAVCALCTIQKASEMRHGDKLQAVKAGRPGVHGKIQQIATRKWMQQSVTAERTWGLRHDPGRQQRHPQREDGLHRALLRPKAQRALQQPVHPPPQRLATREHVSRHRYTSRSLD